MSSHQDKELICSDCGGKFLHSAKEKGFQEPRRCKECRQAKKARGGERIADRGKG